MSLVRAYAAALEMSRHSARREIAELRRRVLAEWARRLFERARLDASMLDGLRLGPTGELPEELKMAVQQSTRDVEPEPHALAHSLGNALDTLQAIEARPRGKKISETRKHTGSYFTPIAVAERMVRAAFGALADPTTTVRVCDPAVGGGAFLLEAARALVVAQRSAGVEEEEAFRRVHSALYGVDASEIAIAVTEAALLLQRRGLVLEAGPRLAVGDALTGRGFVPSDSERAPGGKPLHFSRTFPEISGGFDWIVGNPPWVAYQGRAARPLDPRLRHFYRRRFVSFRGYPTLQSMFVERSAELAPRGVVSLLLPSSLSDLDGYAAMRSVLTESHEVVEPLEEFGQDAFVGVVQPCFGLIARPRASRTEGSTRAWRLEERAGKRAEARPVSVPDVLARIAAGPSLPSDTFGEFGFQTNREVTKRLLQRNGALRPGFDALFEGRNVREFTVGAPQLFLRIEPEVFERTKCLLRPVAAYDRVDFVVRQTAAYPIAARWAGGRFRNSLLAGYASEEWDTDVLVGLLNSRLYRALHVAAQRDARQATFPQVKVSHLRRLPAPPRDAELLEALRVETQRLEAVRSPEESSSAEPIRAESTEPSRAGARLDEIVARLFGLGDADVRAIDEYLAERAPRALTFLSAKAAAAP